jgi:FlaG/FlaF family flagellin (archaellin)
MKKNHFVLWLFLPLSMLAQTISPSNTAEYCPGVNSSFTFTAPAAYSTASISSPDVNIVSQSHNNSSGVSIVTATISFADLNKTQKITFSYGSNSVDFDFPKIYSLFFSDQLNDISPNTSLINAASCQSENFSVSFSAIPYVNPFTSPKLTYGTITSYQYSLPIGWSLNGGTAATSTTDYKTGGNSVTITSDLTHGNNGVIGIRAINNCSGSLIKGAWKYIPIKRDKPNVSFTYVNPLCSSSTFQVSGVPGWVTNYQWTATASTMVNFSSATSSSTGVSFNYDGQTPISLTLSNSSCSIEYTSADILNGAPKLVLGKPTLSTNLQLYSGSGTLNEVCLDVENYLPFYTNGLPYNTANSTPTWSYVSHTGSPQPSWNGGDSTQLYVYFWRTQQTSLVLQIDATNNCGTTTAQFGFTPISCGARMMASYNYSISPNPTMGNIIVSPKNNSDPISKKTKDAGIVRLSIYDLQNTLRLTKKYDSVKQASLNIGNLPAGTYVLVINNGTGTESHQVILR